jgi:hypothetical protein
MRTETLTLEMCSWGKCKWTCLTWASRLNMAKGHTGYWGVVRGPHMEKVKISGIFNSLHYCITFIAYTIICIRGAGRKYNLVGRGFETHIVHYKRIYTWMEKWACRRCRDMRFGVSWGVCVIFFNNPSHEKLGTRLYHTAIITSMHITAVVPWSYSFFF